MKINTDDIKKLLITIGFLPLDGSQDLYYKQYNRHSNYIIKVFFDQEKISYGPDIQLGDQTTSNFENAENFVVLECVDRLLDKGYAPKSLSLEHKWPMGHKEKGKLDILVFDANDKAYFMIECKTWGIEFEKEKNRMRKDGGQLFSYYIQNKAAKYLCLYTSRLSKGKVEYHNQIVKVEDQWIELSDQKEIFSHWNKNFKENGIFDDWTKPYNVEIRSLTRGQLKELCTEDSGRIFNQFAEILRHNNVSDKPNAFNKILNLFICKIIDEGKQDDEELDFQWFENDSNESLQIRLNNLYKDGMSEFLDIDVTDYSNEQLGEQLENLKDPEVKNKIQQMFTQMRLQKNPEFAFKEVFNPSSFEANSIVVKEVVELLQPYQFRYAHKHQFLGDFFELLLNTSIKQEVGQFFTPAPIAKFIISSFPIKEFIENRIKSNSGDILPVAIDYAAGSGHFLTEWMDEVQNVIDGFDLSLLRREAKMNFEIWQKAKLKWAKNNVFGIEADYRLVKTAKVSSFLNGDGEASIIHANGLDSFSKSSDYKGRLREVSKDNSMDNSQFDVLVTNPPYSVSSFKNTVKYGEESFELFSKFSENSSEIECLFIERAKQLLKVGGYAGIILPSSILSNSGIYSDTRDIISRNFNLKAICVLGPNTFMATGTNTVVLFLERRSINDYRKARKAIDQFFINPQDATVLAIENVFKKFVDEVYPDLDFDTYISFINRSPNDILKNHNLWKSYEKAFSYPLSDKSTNQFYQKCFDNEKSKIEKFILAYNQRTVVISVGEKKEEKEFIGYEFSNRRGHEGIKMLSSGTRLYDQSNILNPEKANYYVYKSFLNEPVEIHESLLRNVKLVNTIDLYDFSRITFENSLSVENSSRINYEHLWGTKKLQLLSDLAILEKGNSITKSDTIDGIIPVVAGGKESSYTHGISNRDGNIITVSASGANAGFVNYWTQPIFASDCSTIKSKDENFYRTKIIFYLLRMIQNQIYQMQKGQAQPHVYINDLSLIKLPVLSQKQQLEILNGIETIEKITQESALSCETLWASFSRPEYFNFESIQLDSVSLMIKRGKSAKYGSSHIGIIKSGQARGYRKLDLSEKYFVDETYVADERILQQGDILINSTGVGTAGRVTIFELSGTYTVDSHITIIRVNRDKIVPKYLLYALANIGFKTLESMATGQSGQIELSLNQIKELRIPLPAMDEQLRIVESFEKTENEIDVLETNIRNSSFGIATLITESISTSRM